VAHHLNALSGVSVSYVTGSEKRRACEPMEKKTELLSFRALAYNGDQRKKGSSSFLQKRTKKLLSIRGKRYPMRMPNEQKSLLLFSKRSASLLLLGRHQ
jgi:hypothetical protein